MFTADLMKAEFHLGASVSGLGIVHAGSLSRLIGTLEENRAIFNLTLPVYAMPLLLLSDYHKMSGM